MPSRRQRSLASLTDLEIERVVCRGHVPQLRHPFARLPVRHLNHAEERCYMLTTASPVYAIGKPRSTRVMSTAMDFTTDDTFRKTSHKPEGGGAAANAARHAAFLPNLEKPSVPKHTHTCMY